MEHKAFKIEHGRRDTRKMEKMKKCSSVPSSKLHIPYTKGFTLIEVLITIAIAGIIMLIVAGAFSKTTGIKALDKEVNITLSLLGQARNQTLSAKGALVYGVHFEADKAVLFSGSTYSSSDLSNVTEPINPLVQISTIALTGGGSEVVFKRLTGETDHSGTVVLSIADGQTKTVTVFATGLAQSD